MAKPHLRDTNKNFLSAGPIEVADRSSGRLSVDFPNKTTDFVQKTATVANKFHRSVGLGSDC